MILYGYFIQAASVFQVCTQDATMTGKCGRIRQTQADSGRCGLRVRRTKEHPEGAPHLDRDRHGRMAREDTDN